MQPGIGVYGQRTIAWDVVDKSPGEPTTTAAQVEGDGTAWVAGKLSEHRPDSNVGNEVRLLAFAIEFKGQRLILVRREVDLRR